MVKYKLKVTAESSEYYAVGQAHDINRFSKHYTKTRYSNDSNPIIHNHID